MYEQGKNGKNHTVNGTYPHFKLGLKLTEEQKNFFDTYGFLHFKNFVDAETVKAMLAESVRIQNEWISEDRKSVNGVPIKYGTDVDGKRIVQRFAFLNQFSELFQNFLKDDRLKSLFELVGMPDSRVGEVEKDGLVFNHYVNSSESNFSQLGWHTDALRDIFYGNKIMPMLNVGLHLDYSSTDNGGLRILPGTHNKGIRTLLFKKVYFLSNKPDKKELGLNVEPGDLTVHDGRLWHRVAQSPHIGEKSRRRVMYVPIITGKYQPRTEESKPLFYQRLMAITNK
ncbi:MAG: phytanoyl-CoA dioxygenase family protein [Cyclobacteriaceae bacterium]|jgi:ectoine hydroxylase-related dioxygenase (phytanoyl-CoA dioxygenase family)|nr:phytanoyl-CoA dioxygenase family protein [Cyclobacteriaceae bacterium]HQQ83230.1 phytanoyl-CoA dioxygenase family protein [Cyclobacteriaceae bacterium]